MLLALSDLMLSYLFEVSQSFMSICLHLCKAERSLFYPIRSHSQALIAPLPWTMMELDSIIGATGTHWRVNM